MSNVAVNVTLIRKAANVTLREIAEWVGMTEAGYRHLETGKVQFRVDRLQVIAEKFGVEADVFFDDNKTIKAIGEIIHKQQTEAKSSVV